MKKVVIQEFLASSEHNGGVFGVGVLDTSCTIRLEIVVRISQQMPSKIGWLCIPKWMYALVTLA
jgi:hypothetical protein